MDDTPTPPSNGKKKDKPRKLMRSKAERKADFQRREAERKAKYAASMADINAKKAALSAESQQRKAAKQQTKQEQDAQEKLTGARLLEVGLTSVKRVRPEIRSLPDILEHDEQIRGAATGFMDSKNWLMVCTDRRILFLDKVLGGMSQMDIPLETISSVTQKTGVAFGSIDVLGAGFTGKQVTMIPKSEVPLIAKAIQTARREQAR